MDIGQLLNAAVAFSVGPLTVRWYGILISCGMALGIYLAYREAIRQHENPDHLFNILLLIIPLAVIGARLYYVLFNWDWYAANPGQIFTIWKGGLAIHGGVIAGILVLVFYCRGKKLDFFRWTDILIPSLILGQAIGRWGNFANHEAYGSVIEPGSFWSWVPLQVYVDGAYHHPTFLYESIWDFALFIFLIWFIRKPHRVGAVFSYYLIFYSLARFFIEGLRTDSLMLGELRVAQLISLLGIGLGLAALYFIRKKPLVDVAKIQEKTPQYKKPPEQRKKKGKAKL